MTIFAAEKAPRRKFMGIAVFLLCLSGLLTSCYHVGGYKHFFPVYPYTKEQAVKMLHQGIPLGSSVSQVQTWLHNQHIDHEYRKVANDPAICKSMVPYTTAPYPFNSYFACDLRDNEDGFCYNEMIDMYLYFDSHGKLKGYYVEVIGEGL